MLYILKFPMLCVLFGVDKCVHFTVREMVNICHQFLLNSFYMSLLRASDISVWCLSCYCNLVLNSSVASMINVSSYKVGFHSFGISIISKKTYHCYRIFYVDPHPKMGANLWRCRREAVSENVVIVLISNAVFHLIDTSAAYDPYER